MLFGDYTSYGCTDFESAEERLEPRVTCRCLSNSGAHNVGAPCEGWGQGGGEEDCEGGRGGGGKTIKTAAACMSPNSSAAACRRLSLQQDQAQIGTYSCEST